MRRRLPLHVVATLATTFLWSSPAFGHAAFVGSSPEPGMRLEASPSQLALDFTESLNHRLTKVGVVGLRDGARVPVSLGAPSDRRLVLTPASPLPRGAYRVEWHTVSTEDGHALEGTYSFGVRSAALGNRHSVEQSPLARNGWLRILLRGLLYAALLTLVAALLLPLLAGRRWLTPSALGAGVDASSVRDRERRVTADLAWLGVATAVASTVAEAADAAGGLAPAGLADFLLANEAGLARVAVVLLLLGCALGWRRRPHLSAVLALLALGAVAASGHAGSASPRVASIVNDWLHLTAGSLWVGGVALLVLVWGPALRRGGPRERLALARHVLPGFGRVALPAFALVTATGLLSLLLQLGRLDALWTTDYGRLLATKVGLVGLMAAASATHALRLRPRLLRSDSRPPDKVERRHWRLLRSEPALGVAIVAIVASLVAFPLPPRQLAGADAADQAALATSACDPCPLPRAGAEELPVADRAGSQLVAAWVTRSPRAITGTVRVLDVAGRPSGLPFAVLAARTSSCGRGCRRFSRPPTGEELAVAVKERGRRHVATLPTRWHRGSGADARRLLVRAQATMRGLRSVRQAEEVTSGPGSYARTAYRLRAPDRMAYRTNGGVASVVIGRREWHRIQGAPWTEGRYGGGLAFSTRSWFRWTNSARAIRLLEIRRERGRRLAVLAAMDEGTPVWLRLTIDLASHRVRVVRIATRAHFIRARFTGFDERVTIESPAAMRGR